MPGISPSGTPVLAPGQLGNQTQSYHPLPRCYLPLRPLPPISAEVIESRGAFYQPIYHPGVGSAGRAVATAAIYCRSRRINSAAGGPHYDFNNSPITQLSDGLGSRVCR